MVTLSLFFACTTLFHWHLVETRNSSVKIKKIAAASTGITDGLLWDYRNDRLLIAYETSNQFCSYDYKNDEMFCAKVDNRNISSVNMITNTHDKYVVTADNEVLLVVWEDNQNEANPSVAVIKSLEKLPEGSRFNEAKVDPAGRLWMGTLNYHNGEYQRNLGALFSLNHNMILKAQLNSVGLSSGLAWNLKRDKLYYVDSLTYQIASFEYNYKNATIVEKSRDVIFDIKANKINGIPGRIAIDSDGNIWCPIEGESLVIQIDPHNGKLLRSITLPAKRIGSVTFGGPKLRILYATSKGYDSWRNDDPDAGAVFAVHGLGIHGVKEHAFRMDLFY